MNIAIIGYGVVGQALGSFYSEHNVWWYDKETRSSAETPDYVDIAFICVNVDETSLDNLFTAIELADSLKPKYIVVKTTLAVSILNSLRSDIIVMPEFLREATAAEDYRSATTFIHSGDDTFDAFWKQLHPSNTIRLSRHECVLVKLFRNAFLASKVTLFNAFKEISDAADADWEAIVEAVTVDDRIGHSHTQVPGPDGLSGFGGKCFPKDLAFLISAAEQTSAHNLFEAVQLANRGYRRE